MIQSKRGAGDSEIGDFGNLFCVIFWSIFCATLKRERPEEFLLFPGNKTGLFGIIKWGVIFLFRHRTNTEAVLGNFQYGRFYREFSPRVATMKTISFSYHSARMGRRLATALFVLGLQLSLAGFPVGSLRAAGENDERNAFTWKNLQSDIAGVADRTDSNLVNSWGLVINPTAKVFWIADNGTGVSTLYRPDGTPVLLGQSGQNFVTLPPTLVDTATPPAVPTAAPTGIVFNNPATNAFLIPLTNNPAVFLFDGEDGGIWGWNPGVDLLTATLIVKPSSTDAKKNSVYKGLALANRTGVKTGGPTLYATNFRNGTVDVFDSSFKLVTTFVDPNPPAVPPSTKSPGWAPFGIATIDNLLYVTFALQNAAKHDDVAGPGNGFVDVFSPDTGFVTRLIQFTDMTGPLNSPWGLARVPEHEHFGRFNDEVLLVGNFGDGHINAFDIHSGAFLGTLLHRKGQPLEFNGLWALFFLKDQLYFTAGIVDEAHGLFGFIHLQENENSDD